MKKNPLEHILRKKVYVSRPAEKGTGMDSDKIIQELNQRFTAPLPEFYKRRIVFWYDEVGEFRDRYIPCHRENLE